MTIQMPRGLQFHTVSSFSCAKCHESHKAFQFWALGMFQLHRAMAAATKLSSCKTAVSGLASCNDVAGEGGKRLHLLSCPDLQIDIPFSKWESSRTADFI